MGLGLHAFFCALAFMVLLSSLAMWMTYIVGYERAVTMAKKTRITNNIRTLRFMANEMTQQQLADLVGVTRQTILAVEWQILTDLGAGIYHRQGV